MEPTSLTALQTLSRRTLLAQTSAAVIAGTLGIPTDLLAAKLPLEAFNSFGPVDPAVYKTVVTTAFDPNSGIKLVTNFWKSYLATGNLLDAENAVFYAFLWWRALPTSGPARTKAAVSARKMTAKLEDDHPNQPVGFFWSAAFYGLEALSRGVLNAVQLAPTYEKNLRRVHKQMPDYLYGGTACLLGKMYVKMPPFPLSVGDLSKGIKVMQTSEKYALGRFAMWYSFMAEGVLLSEGPQAAERWLDRMADEVKPPTLMMQIMYDMSVVDADAFRAAMRSGQYDKYRWDPYLQSLEQLRQAG